MKKIEWKTSVSIFKDKTILKQLGIAIGIPFGVVAIVIAVTSGKSIYTFYSLGLIGTLMFLTWLLIMLVYRGKYEVEFVIDDKGILCRTQSKQMKKNRVINILTMVLGLISKNPTATGVGMMAESRQEVFLRWNRITKVKYIPKNYNILLRGGWTENISIFCTKDNYSEVEQEIKTKTKINFM